MHSFLLFSFLFFFVGCLQATETLKSLMSGLDREVLAEAERCKNQMNNIDKNKNNEENNIENNNYHDGHIDKKIKTTKSPFSSLIGRQIFYDAAAGEFHNFTLPPKRIDCAVCGNNASIKDMNDTRLNLDEYATAMKKVCMLLIILSVFNMLIINMLVINMLIINMLIINMLLIDMLLIDMLIINMLLIDMLIIDMLIIKQKTPNYSNF